MKLQIGPYVLHLSGIEFLPNPDAHFGFMGREISKSSRGEIDLEILKPIESFAPLTVMGELDKNWRWGKRDSNHIVQFWCDGHKAFSLELEVDENFNSASLCPIASHPQKDHLGYLLISSLRWLLVHRLVIDGGFLLHGGSVKVKNDCLVVSGPSGAGKSTFCSFFKGSAFDILSDETIALIPDQAAQKWHVWGTPWPGLLEASLNQGGEVREFFFLRKDQENFVSSLDKATAYRQIWSEVFAPPTETHFFHQVEANVSAFLDSHLPKTLSFKKDHSIVEFSKWRIKNNESLTPDQPSPL